MLLAIDDADVRCSFREHLSAHGFVVFATGEARVALQWAERKAADVIVADVLLPGTRIAIPHVLRRRNREECPRLVGVAEPDAVPDERLRTALGYDLLIPRDMPLAVLTKTLLDLRRSGI